jgi:hypothetical protein
MMFEATIRSGGKGIEKNRRFSRSVTPRCRARRTDCSARLPPACPENRRWSPISSLNWHRLPRPCDAQGGLAKAVDCIRLRPYLDRIAALLL